MKAIISFIILIVLVSFSFSQSFVQQWVARYNGPGNTIDYAYKVAVDNSGNVYVTGYSTGATTGKDMFTMKYNPDGTVLWSARYNGPNNGGDYSFAIVVDQQGNSYITGRSDRGGIAFSDITTIKYDPNGNQLWAALYDGVMHSVDEGKTLLVDNSGNVYVTGKTYNTSALYYDIVTIKYNSAGVQQWVNLYNGIGNHYDVANGIGIDNQGNIYVCGETVVAGADFLTLKINPDGTQAWFRTYDGPANGGDGAYAMGVDASGNVIVTGASYGGAATSYDFATIKYDGSGNQLWLKRFNGIYSSTDFANALAVDNNGNVIVTGSTISTMNLADSNFATIKYSSNGTQLWAAFYTRSSATSDVSRAITCDESDNIYVTGNSSVIGFTDDYATVKYSPDGVPLWAFVYNGPDNNNDYSSSIAVDNNTGNVFITGRSFSTLGGYDYTTIKYGDLVGLINTGTTVPNSFSLYQNYPNPFNPQTKFKFDLPRNSTAGLIVFDVQGKSVFQKNFGILQPGQYEYTFDAVQSGLSSGVYFYRITAGEFTGTKKMVLVK